MARSAQSREAKPVAALQLVRHRSRLCRLSRRWNGACRSAICGHCSRSCCSTASRPGFPGSPSCASGRRSAPPSTGSIRPRSRAMGRPKRERLMADSGIVRNRAKIEASVGNAECLSRDRGEAGLCALSVGVPRRQADPEHVSRRTARFRPRRRLPDASPRTCSNAASNSSGRPSSMRSCRRSAWSTTMW